MARQLAFINSNGDPVSVMTPGTDDMYQEGQQYGDYVAWYIAEDAANFMATKYYDFDTQAFATRMTRPSEFHFWNKTLKIWQFDRDKAIDWVRIERNKRLALCDWTQVPDAPLSEEQKEAWRVYRQALRDFPATLTNIQSMNDIVWPTG